MKKLLALVLVLFIGFGLAACGDDDHDHDHDHEEGTTVEARAIFDFAYAEVNEVEDADRTAEFEGSSITFIGELEGGTVIFSLPHGDHFHNYIANTNPSREHPSFESGYWHHHLYAGSTEAGSPRINFYELIPHLGIDFNPEATDNTQSTYQHGNLHYVVETGEYRLRFMINGDTVDLFFVER